MLRNVCLCVRVCVCVSVRIRGGEERGKYLLLSLTVVANLTHILNMTKYCVSVGVLGESWHFKENIPCTNKNIILAKVTIFYICSICTYFRTDIFFILCFKFDIVPSLSKSKICSNFSFDFPSFNFIHSSYSLIFPNVIKYIEILDDSMELTFRKIKSRGWSNSTEGVALSQLKFDPCNPMWCQKQVLSAEPEAPQGVPPQKKRWVRVVA